MPINRANYPKNWNQIAHDKKSRANWRCEYCDRPCRKPGESWPDFIDRIEKHESDWYDDLGDWIDDLYFPKLGRFTLTTAHLDQNPKNNEDSNLAALCPTCHNRHDARSRASNRRANIHKRRGQIELNLDACMTD